MTEEYDVEAVYDDATLTVRKRMANLASLTIKAIEDDGPMSAESGDNLKTVADYLHSQAE